MNHSFNGYHCPNGAVGCVLRLIIIDGCAQWDKDPGLPRTTAQNTQNPESFRCKPNFALSTHLLHQNFISYSFATTLHSSLCYQSQQMRIMMLFMRVVNISFADNVSQEQSLAMWSVNQSLNTMVMYWSSWQLIACIYCTETGSSLHDDVIKWKHFPRYWPFVRGIHRSPVPGEFPAQRPVTRSFDVFFDLRLNKRLSKQWWGRWFQTLSHPLWRRRNGFRLWLGAFPVPNYWINDDLLPIGPSESEKCG